MALNERFFFVPGSKASRFATFLTLLNIAVYGNVC